MHSIPGRARLFEVVQKVRQANALRRLNAPGRQLTGASSDAVQLAANPALAIDYITAPPRMALYMQYSTRIYNIYLQYVAPEDIHVYSIDEVFIDATNYLFAARQTPHEFARTILMDILRTTGITATAGIGTNLYLAKVAMDIVAKHIPADKDGVRIAQLDEMSYRRQLWDHRPLTDFWRVGRGYAKKLESFGLYTMGDIARCSISAEGAGCNEDLLYRLFGVNAEFLIDHAWGWEPCTIADIKAYKPSTNSLGSGQVLHCACDFDQTKLIVREMTDLLVLQLVRKGLVTDQLTLTVGYDIENLTDPARKAHYHGPVTIDMYGRRIPKHAHGTANLGRHHSSTRLITEAVMQLYDRITDPNLLVKRLNVTANHVITETEAAQIAQNTTEQLDLFTDYEAQKQRQARENAALEKEKRMQRAMLSIQEKYGKNAILKGMNLQEGATTKDRNEQIGGHKA